MCVVQSTNECLQAVFLSLVKALVKKGLGILAAAGKWGCLGYMSVGSELL